MQPTHFPHWTRLLLLLCLAVALSVPLTTPLLAQEPQVPPVQPTTPSTDLGTPASTDDFFDENTPDASTCPPSTMTKILVGVIGLALLVVCYFLIVHIVERRYIQQDRSATLGRHVGFSVSILITVGGTLGAYWGLTKCPWDYLWPWLLVGGGVWVVHLLYLIVVARND